MTPDQTPGDSNNRLRIAMTLSGAVSLGAFEGGALAALLVGLQELGDGDRPVVIDVMSGASAGSMTALLSAWILLQGADPVALMSEAWVEGPAIDSLRSHDTSAPLSGERLDELGAHLFRTVPQPPAPRQTESIRVSMALAALRGFGYHLPSLERDTPIEATTYLDWHEVTFAAGDPPTTFTEPPDASPLKFSLASGANALGFPPVVLDRSADRDQYLENGVTNFPDSGHLWYTDGGTIDNEPLGRTIGLANEADQALGHEAGGRRLHLLIHPHPTAPPSDAAWSDPGNRPTWTHTLTRALHVGMTQSLYDDLHQMEKTNSRLKWRDELRSIMNRFIEGLPGEASGALQEELQAEWSRQQSDQAEIRSMKLTGQKVTADAHPPTDQGGGGAEPEASAEELFEQLLDNVAGLVDKEPIRVEVISPLIVAAPGQPIEDLLAGEFLAHFGGFIDEDLRWSDFALGYDCMVKWMERGWTDHGVDADTTKKINDGAARGRRAEWTRPGEGTKSIGKLGWHDKLSAARLAVHMAHVVEHDLRHPDTQD